MRGVALSQSSLALWLCAPYSIMELNFTVSCFAISMIFCIIFLYPTVHTRQTTDVSIDRYNVNDELSHQWPSSSRPNIFLYSFMILY